jgi:hypothetical protein
LTRRAAILVFLAAGLAAFGLVVLHRPPAVPPPAALHPTVRQVALAQKRLESLVALNAPRPALSRPFSPAPPPASRTLRVSEEDLNVFLAGSPAARRLLAAHGIRAIQVFLLEPSGLTIRATMDFHGHPQNVQFDGLLTPDPSLGLRFTVTQAHVGRFPVPALVLARQADALAARFSRSMRRRLPITVQSVRIEGKTLLLSGPPAPAAAKNRKGPASPPPASPARR